MHRYILTIIISLSILSFPSYADKMRIAVLDFNADGVAKSTARKISDLIRTEMINTKKYTVIERKQMKVIFKEQNLQMTGCFDETCAIKVGKLLSAQKILIGTIMKLGKPIIINGRIIDVERGTAEYGAKQSAKNLDEILNAVSIFTKKLTGDVTHRTENSCRNCILKTGKQRYTPNESIKVIFSGLPGNSSDWITIVSASSASDNYNECYYTKGKTHGTMTFNGLPKGDYEVRLFLNWQARNIISNITSGGGYDVKARYRFKVR